MAIYAAIFLACLISCTGKSANVAAKSSKETQVSDWLMTVFKWYEDMPANAGLDVAWNETGIPWMRGKPEFIAWLSSSNYFSPRLVKEIQTYLEQQEADAQNDPELDHFICQEEDLLSGRLLSGYTSIEGLALEEDPMHIIATFTLNGYRLIGNHDTTAINVPLRYRLNQVGGLWQIDMVSSKDNKGQWNLHWNGYQ